MNVTFFFFHWKEVCNFLQPLQQLLAPDKPVLLIKYQWPKNRNFPPRCSQYHQTVINSKIGESAPSTFAHLFTQKDVGAARNSRSSNTRCLCVWGCICVSDDISLALYYYYYLFCFQYISKTVPTTECVISHGAEGAGNYAGSRMSTRSHHSTTASHASRYDWEEPAMETQTLWLSLCYFSFSFSQQFKILWCLAVVTRGVDLGHMTWLQSDSSQIDDFRLDLTKYKKNTRLDLDFTGE